MWWEIIPGLAIICGCVTAVGGLTITVQKLQHGGKVKYNVKVENYLIFDECEKEFNAMACLVCE